MFYLIEGFALQASLILALGAQNIFVMESGLKGNRPLFVASVCSLCDTSLIMLGVLGAASIFLQFPLLKIGFGGLGVAFLFLYGLGKIRESRSSKIIAQSATPSPQSTQNTKKILLLTLGFSLLNPHVYLDTLILIGGFATQYPEVVDRVLFGSGASLCSWLWFFALALAAKRMRPFLQSPKAMRRVALVAGTLLVLLGVKLSFDVYAWVIDATSTL